MHCKDGSGLSSLNSHSTCICIHVLAIYSYVYVARWILNKDSIYLFAYVISAYLKSGLNIASYIFTHVLAIITTQALLLSIANAGALDDCVLKPLAVITCSYKFAW